MWAARTVPSGAGRWPGVTFSTAVKSRGRYSSGSTPGPGCTSASIVLAAAATSPGGTSVGGAAGRDATMPNANAATTTATTPTNLRTYRPYRAGPADAFRLDRAFGTADGVVRAGSPYGFRPER